MSQRITNKPPRWKQGNSIYFLTMCTFERIQFLHKKRVPEMLIKSLKFCQKKIKELIAYTIMPDHLHLIVEIEDAEDLSSFLRDFKRHTSKEIKKITRTKVKHVWQ